MHIFIKKKYINEILEKTDILEVIQSKIEIKKTGKNYSAVCPFHQESKPSFTVYHHKQYFYCFGCKIHGNVIDFLMQYEKISFVESIQTLAKITGIKITQYKKKTTNQKEYINQINQYHVLKKISYIYHKNIQFNHSYLAKIYLKKRNINSKMINEFQIGYCHHKFCILNNILSNKKKYIPILEKEGLLKIKNNIPYDTLQYRIIFPIKNQFGKVIGFGGRSIYQYEPKYINSPTTTIFNKSHNVYGIDKIDKIKKPPYILIVEGYFDVISLTQYKIYNVVALLGTIITKYQISMLFKFTDQLIYCYDGDKAGKIAIWKTFKNILPYVNHQKSVKFIFLSPGEDPDSTIHSKGKNYFLKKIQYAKNILDCFIKIIFKKMHLYSISDKAKILHITIPLINKINDPYIKISLKQKLGNIIGITDEIRLNQIFYTKKKKNYTHNYKLNNIRILMSLIIQYPVLHLCIPYHMNELKKINIKGIKFFIEIFNICKKYNCNHTGQIIEIYRKKKNINIIKQLSCLKNMINKKNIKITFIQIIKKIYHTTLIKKYNKLIIKDRLKKINKTEKNILWLINKTIAKNK
ncbi:DNA primase [Buchnera aphidicola]|uniref:DNA primase n=1 Tax=Buchnera aphidicola TaxID=9 RepID=UPI0031B81888